MSRRKKGPRPPVPLFIDRLEQGWPSGLAPSGKRLTVRAGGVGATLEVRPSSSGEARRLSTLTPAPDAVEPACPLFGACGGCQLQEMPLQAQRQAKGEWVSRTVGAPCDGVTGAEQGYGYRNKLELSFGARRFVTDAERDAGAPEGEPGSFLGFHPPGFFGRIIPVQACPLGSEAMNRLLGVLHEAHLAPSWDSREHTGTWRHVVLREDDEGVLVTLVTSTAASRDELQPLVDSLVAAGAAGVLWIAHDRVAEVATGELREVLAGRAELHQRLGAARLSLPHDAFFQVNSRGAEVLLQVVGDALFGPGGAGRGGTLLDLYCGVGALGLGLAARLGGARIVGVELHEGAILTARANADALGVPGTWVAGPVEDVLPTLSWEGPTLAVVDPPRAGLHPRAARFLADLQADVLVYVACNPASLARDRAVLEAGGWRLESLCAVDLFPQTRHVEAVARLVRA